MTMAKKAKKKLSEAELVNRASVIASLAIEFMRDTPMEGWNDEVMNALGKGRLLFEGALSMAGRTERIDGPDDYLDRLTRELGSLRADKKTLTDANRVLIAEKADLYKALAAARGNQP